LIVRHPAAATHRETGNRRTGPEGTPIRGAFAGSWVTVITRLTPYREQITALAAELAHEGSGAGVTLNVIRYYDDEDGEEESEREEVLPDGRIFERLPGQHQLLGWEIDSKLWSFSKSLAPKSM
jgi:hypothetical protein